MRLKSVVSRVVGFDTLCRASVSIILAYLFRDIRSRVSKVPAATNTQLGQVTDMKK